METTVQATESFCTYIVRDELTNTEDYPQLEEMSEEEEVKDFIKWNASDLYKKGDDSYSLWDELLDSLWAELLDQDIVKNKITGDETEVLVD